MKGRKIDFEFPERKEQHTEKDYHELSIRNEALWHSLISDLNLPPAKFKKHYVFEKKKQAQLQKDKEILIWMLLGTCYTQQKQDNMKAQIDIELRDRTQGKTKE